MTSPDIEYITIEVVYALPEEQQLVSQRVQVGTCARDALNIVLTQGLVVIDATDAIGGANSVSLGVYGQAVDDTYVMKNGDRLEIYRPLLQDPKERRRKIAEQK